MSKTYAVEIEMCRKARVLVEADDEDKARAAVLAAPDYIIEAEWQLTAVRILSDPAEVPNDET